jgi:hypothetical protein
MIFHVIMKNQEMKKPFKPRGPGFCKNAQQQEQQKTPAKDCENLILQPATDAASSKLGRAASAKLQVSLQVYTF